MSHSTAHLLRWTMSLLRSQLFLCPPCGKPAARALPCLTLQEVKLLECSGGSFVNVDPKPLSFLTSHS